MASMRELKKRLKSVRVAGQLAGAMRTVSSAKYSRVQAVSAAYKRYALSCGKLLSEFSSEIIKQPDNPNAPVCFVLVGANRGLCGGYNTELFAHYAAVLRSTPGALTVPVGKKASEFCREKKLEVLRGFDVSDIPSFDEARAVSEYLRSLYESGSIGSVSFVCQKFVNMLTRTPETRRFLPAEASDTSPAGAETLFLPDRKTVLASLYPTLTDAFVYSILLECASGAQAATLTAMRSAYDNASEASQKLETAINRRRQTEVTAAVLETASDSFSK